MQISDEMVRVAKDAFKDSCGLTIHGDNAVRAAIEAALAAMWRPISEAPTDGQSALVYRPLAETSGDKQFAIKRLIGGNNHCWDSTVPTGQKPTNPTDGACHVTHFMPLPSPPSPNKEDGK
jgi:hypothetical protein